MVCAWNPVLKVVACTTDYVYWVMLQTVQEVIWQNICSEIDDCANAVDGNLIHLVNNKLPCGNSILRANTAEHVFVH
jgi:hypothetical protein